ncbi:MULTISPECIES: type II secretion system F family protein [unclassified Massilia]|uniref:type II secretion system F family protein n=1 Tax=unclassified Massilia TaxID=2609279 RepID=UPI001784C8AF|nr:MULTISPECIES: type II secretion system F family protein [unclassified Massilia]MBD8530943.1 type II secretion system F family protein [Massilia sp. CFBP 13647]MBD8674644.1 type II secretion system F family protein [Massilia sp. CFBP 13721]
MTTSQLLILALLFLLIFGVAALAMLLLTRNPLKVRLSALDERESVDRRRLGTWRAQLARMAEPLAKLSVPAEGWESSPVRLRFINAGWRDPATPGLFHAGKTALTVGLPLLAWLFLRQDPERAFGVTFLGLVSAAACGYYVPDIVLKRRIAHRQREIFESFPDALDLMVVCVEAGLAMDAALARVGAEIGLKSPVLAEELQLVTLEMRAGSAKEKALRNLALRTGVEDVDSLAKMLIQADRFGTSVGLALRIQSDQLRTRRRQLIEENAAKIATKLLFPLIFCIFPALLVVLLGPACLQIMRTVMPVATGAN